MADSRTQEILEAWRAVADAAVLPQRAPKPARRAGPFGLALAALALSLVIVVLASRGYEAGRQGAAGSGIASVPSAAPSMTIPTPTPGSTATASPAPLASVGGTCTASQFVLGTATNAGEFGTLGTIRMIVTQPIRNAGASCVVEVPTMIGVASDAGPFEPVAVLNRGTATSFVIGAGQAASIVFEARWWMLSGPDSSAMTPPPCIDPIKHVTRAEVPLAAGIIEIDLGTVWREVCTSPPSVWLTVEF